MLQMKPDPALKPVSTGTLEGVDILAKFSIKKRRHTNGTFTDHLFGTRQLLKDWGCGESLCLAGLCHSFYGTEGTFGLRVLNITERERLQSEIGEEAENLVYLYSIVKRKTIYDNLEASDFVEVIDRTRNIPLAVSCAVRRDLLTLDIANTLEQVGEGPLLLRLAWKLCWKDRYSKAICLLPSNAAVLLRQIFSIA